jgi:hypothetical protein
MEINFRAVERAVTFVYYVLAPQLFKGLAKVVCCAFPLFGGADAVFGAGGKLEFEIGKPKGGVNLLEKLDCGYCFVL